MIGTVSQGRTGNRRRRLATEIREEQIIHAATLLYREKGYHGTSMQDIAEALGLQKGSLYLHVTSKEDLLFHIVSTGAEGILRELEAISGLPLRPTEKLKEAIRHHITFTASGKDVFGVVLEDTKHLSQHRRRLIEGLQKRYEEIFQGILEEGVRSGEFRPIDVKVVSFAFLGMCNWLYRWYSTAGRLRPEEIANIFTGLIMRSIALLPPGQPSETEVIP